MRSKVNGFHNCLRQTLPNFLPQQKFVQKHGPEHSLQLRPITFNCCVVLRRVGHIPYRVDVEFLPKIFNMFLAVVVPRVVQKHMNSFFPFTSSTNICKKLAEVLTLNRIIFYKACQQAVTSTDSRYHCLTWCVSSSVFKVNIFFGQCPCPLLISSRSENSFVDEHQVALVLLYGFQFVRKIHYLFFEF